MTLQKALKGLSLKVGPLGENDRLLTMLSEEEGISRFAVPGARRPRSSLAATSPLTLLELQVTGQKGLRKVRQIKILRSYSKLGERLETLAAAQAITELSLLLVAGDHPIPGILETVLLHLGRLEEERDVQRSSVITLAKIVQACVHLLALGGYGLPIQNCCQSGAALDPPLGDWDWRCSLIPDEGFAIGALANTPIQLNPSELALLQRLLRPVLPTKRDGDLLGPKDAWLKLLSVVEYWINNHLPRNLCALKMLRESIMNSIQ